MSAVLERRVKKHLTEQRPAPLEMTDTEILDWMNEWSLQMEWNRATPQYNECFTVYGEGIKGSAPTLREAVCLAAAKLKEINS